MRRTTKQAAHGKWDGILSQLLGEQAVSRRHGPCPICKGTDRYRYDNKRNEGDWFCNVCGAGDGFRLLQEALGISFAEAAQRIDRIVNNIEEKPFKADIDLDKRRFALNELWGRGGQPLVVSDYLTKRGIPSSIIEVAKDLRGVSSLTLYDGPELKGNYPAMLALIRNSKGEAISIHRTYVMDEGKEKKIMPPLESITGGAVRLGEPDTTLVLAEGIETALAAWAVTGHPAWATISAHGMDAFTSIPKHVTRVIICADNDASFTGQAAAFECAKHMRNRLRVETIVIMPKSINQDMLDVMVDLRASDLLAEGFDNSLNILKWVP